jgi:signal peptidase II
VLREWLARARNPLAVQVGLLVAFGFIVLDQATKEVAETLLRPGEFVPWVSDSVGWQLVYNPGGAFGLPAPSWIFFVVTALVVLIVARTLTSTPSLLQATAYGLLLSGALGNLLDRILRPGDPDGFFLTDGFVVDFVAWGSFPRFNIADSAITVGFVLLVVALWIEERDASRASRADAATAPEAADDGAEDTGDGVGDTDDGPAAETPEPDDAASSDAVGASTQEPRGRT